MREPHRTLSTIKVIEVVYVRALVGSGDDSDPFRMTESYWSLDGKLLAYEDTFDTEEEE